MIRKIYGVLSTAWLCAEADVCFSVTAERQMIIRTQNGEIWGMEDVKQSYSFEQIIAHSLYN